ncbi:hypothetical protein WJX77_007569 [Trebouxia sp. C0004]
MQSSLAFCAESRCRYTLARLVNSSRRKEAGGSDNEDADGDSCPEGPYHVAGTAARTRETGSDQHTEGSAKVRRSGRQTAKARAAEPQGQPSTAASSRRPVSAPATSISRTADTVRQPLSPTGQGINRAAASAAFAAAAASFGKRKSPVADRPSSAPSSLAGMIPSGTGVRLPKPSDQSSGARPPASQAVGSSGLASLVPPSQGAGLTCLASMVFQQHRRAGRPPKPPANQQLPTALVLAMQQSSGRVTASQPQLPVLSNPHGPASFPYFKEGFMTQPFSVSAFEDESKVAFAKLEDFLTEAAILQQEQGEVIEAASLRVAPLEEQRQAAVQTVLAQTKATRRQAPMRQDSPGQTPATAAGTAEGAVMPGAIMSRGTTACSPTPAEESALLSETSGSGNAPGNSAAEALSTSLVVAPPSRSTPAVTAESAASVPAAGPGKGESGPLLTALSGGSTGAGPAIGTTSARSEDTAMADASSSLPAVAAFAMDAAQSAATAANGAVAAHGRAGASCNTATAAQTGITAAQTAPTAAPEGITGPTDGSTATPAGRGTGQSSIQSPVVHSGARVAAAAQEHAKAHAEARRKAEAEVKIKWQEGLDEAAKGLKSVKLVSNPSSKAADRRWSRNLGSNNASTSAGETADRDPTQLSAAGSANLFSPATTTGPAQEPGAPAGRCCGHSSTKASRAEQGPLLPRPPDDVVLTFCIHRFDRPGWKLMDVAVLSSQKLTALKDVIKCEADANMKSQGQDKPNGYFYIEGDFYNDMRDDGTDLSLDVRQFCRDRNISVPAPKPFAPPAYPPGSANAPYFNRSTQCEPRTKIMEDTIFNDLFLRVGQGAGYVYVHQGCCEHLLELTDVRRAHDADPLLINHYPQVLDQAKWTRRHCCICNPDNKGGEKAQWVTHHDKNAPSNPAFWCDGCYRQMHYNDRHDLQYTGYVAFPYRYELGTMKQQNRKDADTTDDCNDED